MSRRFGRTTLVGIRALSNPFRYRAICLVALFGMLLAIGSAGGAFAQDGKQDVPRTRPKECLAVIEGVGGSATFAELADGQILMGSSGGKFRTSVDGGMTWSAPWQGRDPDGKPLGSAESSLVRLSGKAVGYATRAVCGQSDPELPFSYCPTGYGCVSCIYFYRSEDGGKTWSRPVPVASGLPYEAAMVNNVMIRTSSGRIILPAYGSVVRAGFMKTRQPPWAKAFCWSYVHYSDDDGRTWKFSYGGGIYVADEQTNMAGLAAEPSVVEVEPGKLLMFLRADMGRVYQSWSLDDGETWSTPTATELTATNAPSQLLKIPATGDLLLVWNQESEAEYRAGLRRNRLSCAISRTHGANWEMFQNVDSSLPGTYIWPSAPHVLTGSRRKETEFVRTKLPDQQDPKYTGLRPIIQWRLCTYPAVFIYRDTVLIGHSNAHFDERGEYVGPGRLLIFPLSWFYGGPEAFKATSVVRR